VSKTKNKKQLIVMTKQQQQSLRDCIANQQSFHHFTTTMG